MPYIKKADRKKFDRDIDPLKPENAGELNYVITRITHNYIKRRELRYQYLNEVIGALEAAKLELYRHIVGPYEDTKIKSSGDIGILNEKDKD
jgi:hypothetical protein